MNKKILILLTMVIAMVLVTGTIASSAPPGDVGKWWDERPGGKIDDPSYPNRGGNPDLYWKTQTDNSLAASPHGGFTDSTNLCKTCHAVHGGRPDGYRLLRNSSRETECWFCHEG